MQSVLSLVMLAGLLASLLLSLLFWAGLPVERLLLVSAGVTGTAAGLLSLGEAVLPRWERAWWKPPGGGRATVRLGRLSSGAAGLWFATVGVAFLGSGWLTEHIGPGLLVPLAAAFALALVGMGCDRRRAEAARAAVRQRGWLSAARRGEDDLPADEAQRREDARAELRRSIQEHLTGRTTLQRAETRPGLREARASDAGAPPDGPGPPPSGGPSGRPLRRATRSGPSARPRCTTARPAVRRASPGYGTGAWWTGSSPASSAEESDRALSAALAEPVRRGEAVPWRPSGKAN